MGRRRSRRPPGRLLAARWGVARPALAVYASVGDVVRAGWANPDRAAFVLAELTAIGDGDGDPAAMQAALAVLAPRLAGVVARWRRASVALVDLEDMEADLLIEAIGCLRAGSGPRPPGVIVDAAWGRVRTTRRRQRRAAGREVPVAPAVACVSAGTPAAVTAAGAVVDGFRSGRLSLAGAQALWATGVAGWPGPEAAHRLGCQPAAFAGAALPCHPRPGRLRAVAVLTLGALKAGESGGYYVQSVPDGPAGYYVDGPAAGQWWGGGAERLGLVGEVEAGALSAVLAGADPDTGRMLVAGKAAHRGRTPGFDLTFSPPKSVTLLSVLGEPQVGEQVRDAHRKAVADTMGFIEAEVAAPRRGAATAVPGSWQPRSARATPADQPDPT